ncbi:MAG: hypothetical protein HY964_02990 [Ignavibacteriales bacterium]|nr:hypothetical protein [Ignavibacteriales bacterium]
MKRIIIVLLSIAIQFLWLGGIPNTSGGLNYQNSKTDNFSHVVQNDTVIVTVHEGWNLISLPLNVPDFRTTTLFPTAISKAFGFEGGYIMKDTLEAGTGYWLKFAQNEQITIVGSLQQEYAGSLHAGWNMIGSFNEKIAADNLESDFCGIVTSNYYGYDSGSGYVKADTLEPCKGYWVKANKQGRLFEQKWIKVAGIYKASVTVNPVEPNILYAGTPSDFSSGRNGAILKSTDWGATWDTLVRDVNAHKVVLDPKNPDICYASLGSGICYPIDCLPGILKTTDGGTTWFHADSGFWYDPESPSVDILTIDPNNSQILFAEVYGWFGSYMYRTTNGGVSWSIVAIYYADNCTLDTNYILDGPYAIAIATSNSNIIYASRSLYNDTVLYRSTNGGESWDILHCFSEDEIGSIYSINVNLENSDIIYIGTRKFLRSTDGGQTWQNYSNGLPIPVYANIYLSKIQDVIYASFFDGSIYKSTDKGVTWQSMIKNGDPYFYLQDLDEKNGYIYSTKIDGIYRIRICK